VRQAVEQSIPDHRAARQRARHVEPLIQREGTERILVQVPGLQDPTRLKELLGKTAKLDFRMSIPMCRRIKRCAAISPRRDPLRHRAECENTLRRRATHTGLRGDLTDAQPGFDQRTSEPIVSFRFNTRARANSPR